MRILITGGSGFIGSALIRKFLSSTDFEILNIDKLTYAADPQALSGFENNANYIFRKYSPDKIIVNGEDQFECFTKRLYW